jgi:hypothetical protein
LDSAEPTPWEFQESEINSTRRRLSEEGEATVVAETAVQEGEHGDGGRRAMRRPFRFGGPPTRGDFTFCPCLFGVLLSFALVYSDLDKINLNLKRF